MKVLLSTCLLSLLLWECAGAQTISADTAHVVNNLQYVPGYHPSDIDAIPVYEKYGKGKISLILIPGLGFDASVFDDLIEANKKNFTIYVLTLPGFGHTTAPAMPPPGTSYGDQTWNRSAEKGIIRLIDTEKIKDPILVGHFVSGVQIATNIAADYPGKIGGLLLMGGPLKFISMEKGQAKDYPLPALIRAVDGYTAPVMFKQISKQAWDMGNYLPEVYSLDSSTGKKLWQESANTPMPIMIRYLCEYIASDISILFEKIKCPVLVLRPAFSATILDDPANNYLKPQFIDEWDGLKSKFDYITIVDIRNAAAFVWKDAPGQVYAEMIRFGQRLAAAQRPVH